MLWPPKMPEDANMEFSTTCNSWYTIIHAEKCHDALITPQTRVLIQDFSRATRMKLDPRLFSPMEPKVVRWWKGSFRLLKLLPWRSQIALKFP